MDPATMNPATMDYTTINSDQTFDLESEEGCLRTELTGDSDEICRSRLTSKRPSSAKIWNRSKRHSEQVQNV